MQRKGDEESDMAEVVKAENAIEQANLDAVRGMVAEQFATLKTDVLAEMKAALAPTDRAKLAAISDDKPTPAGGGARVVIDNFARHQRWVEAKRRDPDNAHLRHPDVDHWNTEYIRALTDGDDAKKMHARDEANAAYMRATLQEVTAAVALAMVPLPLAQIIVTAKNRENGIGKFVQHFQAAALSLRIPNAGKATVSMVAEGSVAAQGEPTSSSALLTRKKMQGQFRASRELIQDSQFDVSGYFSERFGAALGEKEEDEITNGDGTGARFTNSFGNAAIATTALIATPNLQYGDLTALFFSVPRPYRRKAIWMGSGTMCGFLSRLLITGGINPVLSPRDGRAASVLSDETDAFGSLLGKPVVEIPITATGTLIFGDPSYYGFLDTIAMEVEASTHVAWATDDVAYKFTQRVDGNMLLPSTFDSYRKCVGVTGTV